MAKSTARFTTDVLKVEWAHLHQPDTFFGTPGDHNITVVVTDDLNNMLKKAKATAGAKKVNGLGEGKDEETNKPYETLKVKSKVFTTKGDSAFPCVGPDARNTSSTPFKGDTVKLILSPKLNARDDSLSIWLNGCQIVDSEGGSTGFTPINGQSEEQSSESDDGDLPF